MASDHEDKKLDLHVAEVLGRLGAQAEILASAVHDLRLEVGKLYAELREVRVHINKIERQVLIHAAFFSALGSTISFIAMVAARYYFKF